MVKSASEIEKKNIRVSSQEFIEKNETYSAIFNSVPNNDKNWILNYMCGGKGVISYKNLNQSVPSEIIDEECNETVKKQWKLFHLQKLLELNNIYNFQDAIILCEIFENRAREMMRKFPYNPRKCTSASLCSSCIHRFLLNTIIVLPTQAEVVDLFEQTLIGGFSCVKTRLGFDSKILLSKDSKNEPKENLKLI